jgi:hypothetical protein
VPGTRPSRSDSTRQHHEATIVARSRPHTLVGRQPELSWFDEHLTASAHGSARTVVLRGDAGAGKFVFLDALRCRAQARGFQLLRATGFEADQELPHAALHSLLAPVPGDSPSSGPLGAALGRARDNGDGDGARAWRRARPCCPW